MGGGKFNQLPTFFYAYLRFAAATFFAGFFAALTAFAAFALAALGSFASSSSSISNISSGTSSSTWPGFSFSKVTSSSTIARCSASVGPAAAAFLALDAGAFAGAAFFALEAA